jgi:hypothetical protein
MYEVIKSTVKQLMDFVGDNVGERDDATFSELMRLDANVEASCQAAGLVVSEYCYEDPVAKHFLGFCRVPATRIAAGVSIGFNPGWLDAMRALMDRAARAERQSDSSQ